MGPWSIIGDFFVGLIRTRQVQGWYRLAASVLITAFVSFWGTWGASIWTIHQTLPEVGWTGTLVLGFANASLSMAVMVYALIRRSPLAKGLSILVPKRIAQEELKQEFTHVEKR